MRHLLWTLGLLAAAGCGDTEEEMSLHSGPDPVHEQQMFRAVLTQLYPQVTQMLAHLRAYQLTGKKLYLDRAGELYKAMQPLKIKGEARYRSPYSAEEMGAKTSDYTTLSSQNYTMMALSLLHRYTGDASIKKEILGILQFLRTHLLHSDGRVLHHWIDGEAVTTDHEVAYCSGCNLQLLYIIWRLPELLEPVR